MVGERRFVLFGCSAVLLMAAGLGRYVFAPHWTARVPGGWEWRTSFVGTQADADEETGVYPAPAPSMYRREFVITASGRLQDAYTTINPTTGKVAWQYVYTAQVDRATGLHLGQPYLGDIYLFPRHSEKRTYRLRQSYLKGVPVAFEDEEELQGLTTYVYSYAGPSEYTESYRGTKEYPGVAVEPGQEIRCTDDQFRLRVWVEPVTGEIVKLDEGCPAGDAVYDVKTAKLVKPLVRWGGFIGGDGIMRLVGKVRHERNCVLAAEYIPGLLALLGIICAAAPLARRGRTAG